MRRAAIVLVVAFSAATASAEAATVSCTPGRYLSADPNGAKIDRLRATNLPRKTDGYAPRCLVAESAVQEVIATAARNAGRVTRVRLFGARWTAGTWRVTVRNDASGSQWTVRRGARRISFRSR